jgi:hypothetical protein
MNTVQKLVVPVFPPRCHLGIYMESGMVEMHLYWNKLHLKAVEDL